MVQKIPTVEQKSITVYKQSMLNWQKVQRWPFWPSKADKEFIFGVLGRDRDNKEHR